jgi:hypothetical protein
MIVIAAIVAPVLATQLGGTKQPTVRLNSKCRRFDWKDLATQMMTFYGRMAHSVRDAHQQRSH